MKSKIVSITELKLNDNNPRLIKDPAFQELVQSIVDFPEMLKAREVVVDEEMRVLGGNMRVRAMMELGYEKVKVKIAVGWTEKQKAQFIIKDNISYGEWDWDILANQWEAEELNQWGLNVWEDTTAKKEEPTQAGSQGGNSNSSGDGENETKLGVMILCKNEKDQKQVYEDLTSQGYECKVVVI